MTPEGGPSLGVLDVDGARLSETPQVTVQRLDRIRRDSIQRRSLAVADLIAVGLAYVFAGLAVADASTADGRIGLLVSSLPLWVLMNKLLGLYDRDASVIYKSTLDELPRLLHAVALGTGILYLVWPLVPGLELEREQVLAFAGLCSVLMPGLRLVARRASAKALPRERCLIVGSGQVAREVAEKVRGVPEYGVELVGFIDEARRSSDLLPEGVHILGDVHELEHVCASLDVDRVVIAFTTVSHEDLLNVVSTATRLDIKVSIVPRLFEVLGPAFEIDHAHGMTLHGLRGLQPSHSSLRLKRAMDLVALGSRPARAFPRCCW